jgi:hypothetical protein
MFQSCVRIDIQVCQLFYQTISPNGKELSVISLSPLPHSPHPPAPPRSERRLGRAVYVYFFNLLRRKALRLYIIVSG